MMQTNVYSKTETDSHLEDGGKREGRTDKIRVCS